MLLVMCAASCVAWSTEPVPLPAPPSPHVETFVPAVFFGGQSNAVFAEPYLSRPLAPVLDRPRFAAVRGAVGGRFAP